MTIQKNDKVESYSFGQLVPSESSKKIEEFKLESLEDTSAFKRNISDEVIRQEREFEAASRFAISPLTRESRGLLEQEEEDYEKRVSAEVEKRLLQIKENSIIQGLEEGRRMGQEEAYSEAKELYESKIGAIEEMLVRLNKDCKEIYEKNEAEVYRMVKNLTKWVILKEVDEKYYLARLLEKLIHEINTKSNLVIRVNEEAFGYMPEIVKIVERKVGKLTNTRLEIDTGQNDNGIVLEAENSIIDGSLESQMNNIEKLFQNVGINE